MKQAIKALIKDASKDFSVKLVGNDVWCKLCGAIATSFGTTDFNKSCNQYPLPRSDVAVQYHRCSRCELIFTNFFDDWTQSDFSELIYNSDYIKVDPDYVGTRAEATAMMMSTLLQRGKETLSLLDFGSGEGLFAEHMRSHGFLEVASYDPFSNPVKPRKKYDIVTAFEVIEHSTDPAGTFRTLLDYTADGGFIFVGQSMQPPNISEIGVNWWYIAPRNGHVSFYSHRTIRDYATQEGLMYRSSGGDFILHRPALSAGALAIFDNMPNAVGTIELRAPKIAPLGDGEWHDVEVTGDNEYRWTRHSEVNFGVFCLKDDLLFVDIPFFMEIDENFSSQCFARIGEKLVNLIPRDGKLSGFVDGSQLASREAVRISLLTPVTSSPKSRGLNEDDRKLGLAIPI